MRPISDRGVFRCAVVRVEREEQWGENTALRSSSADRTGAGCVFSQLLDVVRYVLIETSVCVCAKENLCHPFIQRSDRVNQWERNRNYDSV